MIGVTQSRPLHQGWKKTDYAIAYCGLCKCIGRDYSQVARLGLSRDMVFLLECLTGEEEKREHARIPGFASLNCFSIPSRAELGEVYRYCAAVNVLAAGYKLEDQVVDEGRRRSRWARRVLRGDLERARRRLIHQGFPVREGDRCIADLRALEARPACGGEDSQEVILTHSEPMERLYGLVFRRGAEIAGREGGAFETLGRHLGRATYLIDAVKDLEDDRTSGSPNPLLRVGNPDGNREFAISLVREAVADSGRILAALQPDRNRAAMITSLLPCPGCRVRKSAHSTVRSHLSAAWARALEWREETCRRVCEPGVIGAFARLAIVLAVPFVFAGAAFGLGETGQDATLAASSDCCTACCSDCCGSCCSACCGDCCNGCCNACCGEFCEECCGADGCHPCGTSEKIAESKRRVSCGFFSCLGVLLVTVVGILAFVGKSLSRQRDRERMALLQRGQIYRIARGGMELGAWGSVDIRTMLASGQILPTDWCLTAGMTEWRPVGEVFPPATKIRLQ